MVEIVGPARLSDISKLMGVGIASLSPQIKVLEEAGFIKRQTDPRDGRASLVRVTAPGRKLVTRMRAARLTMVTELLSDWSDRDASQAAYHLGRFAELLEQGFQQQYRIALERPVRRKS